MTPLADRESERQTSAEPAQPSAAGVARVSPVLPAGLACVFCLLVLLPFVLGPECAPPGSVFGGTLKALGDEGVYMSAVRQGADGLWLWRDQFMVRTPAGVFSYLTYMFFGHLGALLDLSVPASYALMHGAAALLLFVTLWLMGSFYLQPRERAWFVALALGTSGLYWLDAMSSLTGHELASLPWMAMPPLGGLTSALMGPHETIGTAGQVMVLTGLLAVTDRRNGRVWAATAYGACGMVLVSLTLPMLLPESMLVVAVLALLSVRAVAEGPRRRLAACRELVCCCVIGLPAVPAATYYFWEVKFGAWSTGDLSSVQGRPFVEAVLQWGVVLLVGAWAWLQTPPATRPLANALALWCCAALACMALPLWQSFRFSTGMTTMAGGLLGLAVVRRVRMPRVRARLLLLAGLGAAIQYVFMVTLLLAGRDTVLYMPRDRQAAMNWIGAHCSERDVVLAPLGFSNRLPSVARSRLVAGYGLLTFDMTLRDEQLHAFYDPSTSPQQRVVVLRATSADLVVYDPTDSEDGTFDPRGMPGLEQVFASGDVAVLRVSTAV